MQRRHPINIDTVLADEAMLWHALRQGASASARSKLIEHYLPYARVLAAKLYAKRHSEEFEFDDFMQFASIGLVESVDRYEYSPDATFKTFASKRIHGAVLNGVEKLSDRQDQISTRQRMIAERTNSLATCIQGKRTSTAVFDELADIAIGLAIGFMLDNPTIYQTEEAVQPVNHYDAVELRQLSTQLMSLVEQLPERERLIMKCHYFNQIPFDLIADQQQLSRGRISQLHRNALTALKQRMQQIAQVDVSW
ncbi:MAG: sigma-70 family RNA polymerase sigma factor [Burkholderiales bacterium]|nr:sigma-70 family RNA polymerase sigma factor [Burkholderiales bacterium]